MTEYLGLVRSHNRLVKKINQMIREIALGSEGQTESNDPIEQKTVKDFNFVELYILTLGRE
jgi:hypothetical protein